MKKYISILSLVIAFIVQSCDRSDLMSNSEEQIFTGRQQTKERSSALYESPSEQGNSQVNNIETGDDDEPRKDKSHWRTSNDTIRP